MNTYKILKEKHEKEFSEFPKFFAYSDKQFEEGMQKLGLTPEDTDKILSIGGGGFIRKTDSDALSELFDRHETEMKEAIEADQTGDGFVYDMFNYELRNHEYGYTFDIGPTLEALGLTREEINNNKRLLHGLSKAVNEITKEEEERWNQNAQC